LRTHGWFGDSKPISCLRVLWVVKNKNKFIYKMYASY
jgi:hypothetical protein